ncbi:TPA: hypothetical protein ACH3X2_010212 [Trebouxia sp. C0005]
MPFQQVSSRRRRSFKLRQRRDRTFFEAMEGCAEYERLTVRPLFTYSPPVVAVRFGHLYKGDASQRDVEGLVWQSILTQLPHQLIAMDPQRLGTPTATYDLHFQEQFLQQKHDLFNRGFLTVEYLGKREQLPASSKGSQISPRYAEVVVKQLDPRWARKGITAALLKAAGYSADVAVQTEFVGDLPAHLSCWSNHLGRSDVTVAKVAAPASDPSLRKLPRSIQFQGLSVSISVSRSLQNKHEQRKAKAADTSGKQARRKAKKVKRQASKQQSGQQQAAPPQLAQSEVAGTQPAMEQQGLVPDDEPLLTAIFPLPGGITSLPIVEGPPAALARLHPAPSSGAEDLGGPLPIASSPRASMPDAASPLAGKRRGPESVSDVESLGATEAPSADSLALVPLTPDDSHAPSLRRSSRDHKKPRPYYAASQVEPPDKPSTSKGLQRGFLK